MPVPAPGLRSRTAVVSTVGVGLAVDLVAGVAVGSGTGVSIPTGVGEGPAGGSGAGDIATVTLDSPGTWVPAGGPACSPPQAASARRPAAKLDKINDLHVEIWFQTLGVCPRNNVLNDMRHWWSVKMLFTPRQSPDCCKQVIAWRVSSAGTNPRTGS